MGEHDELENRYSPQFEALLSRSGVVIAYRRDRAGIDTGLHLFAPSEKAKLQGEQRPYWRALASRVWFQLKGIHTSTLSAGEFNRADKVTIKVRVDHLKFWFSSPEPVYLVVYVESVDTFLGIEVREMVERQWAGDFYASLRDRDGDVSVHVPTDAVMSPERIAAMVSHRSMRIDGPAFRGHPLGHRMDPLRSVLEPPPPDVWVAMVSRLLQAHDFREAAMTQVDELTVIHGTLAQTLLWQSPAFAEYGYRYNPSEVRDEPDLEQVFGDTCVVLDSALDRKSFTDDEKSLLTEHVDLAAAEELNLVVLFRGLDLSGTGGLWRASLREFSFARRWHQLGMEALTFLVLTATLVYLEFAPELDWSHVNYLEGDTFDAPTGRTVE